MQCIEALVLEEKQLPLCEVSKHVQDRVIEITSEHKTNLLNGWEATAPIWMWGIHPPVYHSASHNPRSDTSDISTPLHTHRICLTRF